MNMSSYDVPDAFPPSARTALLQQGCLFLLHHVVNLRLSLRRPAEVTGLELGLDPGLSASSFSTQQHGTPWDGKRSNLPVSVIQRKVLLSRLPGKVQMVCGKWKGSYFRQKWPMEVCAFASELLSRYQGCSLKPQIASPEEGAGHVHMV